MHTRLVIKIYKVRSIIFAHELISIHRNYSCAEICWNYIEMHSVHIYLLLYEIWMRQLKRQVFIVYLSMYSSFPTFVFVQHLKETWLFKDRGDISPKATCISHSFPEHNTHWFDTLQIKWLWHTTTYNNWAAILKILSKYLQHVYNHLSLVNSVLSRTLE